MLVPELGDREVVAGVHLPDLGLGVREGLGPSPLELPGALWAGERLPGRDVLPLHVLGDEVVDPVVVVVVEGLMDLPSEPSVVFCEIGHSSFPSGTY